MSQIYLFRCKAEQLPQLDAFAGSLSAQEVVTKSFLQRPTAKVPRGSTWHIGNTTRIDEGGIFFALGREAVVRAQQFDEGTKEFAEVELAQAPFTVGVYDPSTQVAGVLIRQGVSLVAREVGTKLQVLLEATGIARANNRSISVDPLPDPADFIEILRSAKRITRFEFDFSLPNPPDDDEFIQRPLKRYAEKINATEGKASMKGPSLDADELVTLTRAVAAEGDQATANVELKDGGGIQRHTLKHSPLKAAVEATLHEGTAATILRAMKAAYQRIRSTDGD